MQGKKFINLVLKTEKRNFIEEFICGVWEECPEEWTNNFHKK